MSTHRPGAGTPSTSSTASRWSPSPSVWLTRRVWPGPTLSIQSHSVHQYPHPPILPLTFTPTPICPGMNSCQSIQPGQHFLGIGEELLQPTTSTFLCNSPSSCPNLLHISDQCPPILKVHVVITQPRSRHWVRSGLHAPSLCSPGLPHCPSPRQH